MKKYFRIFALLTCILVLVGSIAGCNHMIPSKWYPFNIPWDDSKDNVINVGKTLLEAPAGKHGFLKVKDGHFYFEDGTRIRFWGTNLTTGANFPTHENAIKIAAHMAKYGFNIVRLHHMDSNYAPKGIFDRSKKGTSTLSSEQMDRLDYLIYQFKLRGIYVDINLHVGRKFKQEDGVEAANNLPRNSKQVTLFDRKIIDLQKDYAKQLLTHYNPYTKKKYNEDPCIALIETTNENTLFYAWETDGLFGEGDDPLSPYYIKQLDQKWNKWIKSKYSSTDKLNKAWQAGDDGGSTGLQSSESIEKGNIARAKWAKRDTYTTQRLADNAEFYYSLERDYYKEMLSYIHNDLKVRVPVCTSNNYYGQPDLMAQSEGDFMDAHNYWDLPTFTGMRWDTKSFKQKNLSLIARNSPENEKSLREPFFKVLSMSAIEGKPLIIGEWNHVFPNDYEYELAGLITAYALLQDWDGLFIYTYAEYSSGDGSIWGRKYIDTWLDVVNNPVKMAQMPACASAFIRGDFSSAAKQIVVDYSREDVFKKYLSLGMKTHFNTKDDIPLAAVYTYKIRKGSFNAERTTELSELLPDEEIKALTGGGVYESDTQEICWNSERKGHEYVTFNTSRFQGAVGFIAGKKIELENLELALYTNCSAFLTSMDKKDIGTSGRLLLTLTARQRNMGQERSTNNNSLKTWGKAPIEVETAAGTVKIKVNDENKSYSVFALDSLGGRKTKKQLEYSGGVLSFKVGDDPTVWYEIVQEK